MARGKLFEYAVLYHPKQTKEQAERGEWPKSEVVVPPTTVIGGEDEVKLIAARAIPATHADKLEDCAIAVRPF